MTYTQTYEIQKNNQLLINLPDGFKKRKRVKVIIEDYDDEMEDKIKLMKKASKDPLFLADIEEVSEDFKVIDKEQI